jgi:hypothetical protein
LRRAPCSAGLARNIRLPEVATGAKRLKVLKDGEATFAPRGNVVNVKLDARGQRRTRATGATREAVTLKDAPTQAQ